MKGGTRFYMNVASHYIPIDRLLPLYCCEDLGTSKSMQRDLVFVGLFIWLHLRDLLQVKQNVVIL